MQYQQDLLTQVSGTSVLDCYSNFGSNSGTGKDFDSGSGFRVWIKGRDSGLFRVGNQGQHLGSRFRVTIQGWDSRLRFSVRILCQDLG